MRIVVTPAGRKKYLEVLYQCLLNRKKEFDVWQLWVNTNNDEDINYMKYLAENNDFISLFYSEIPVNGNSSIGQFFKNCTDNESFYLRLDDDIVYIKEGSIKTIFDEREKDTESFLLIGNIVNNSICTFVHQVKGCISIQEKVGYYVMDNLGWQNPDFAIRIHNEFFNKYNSDLNDYKFEDWVLHNYEHISINVICWRGIDFNKFDGIVTGDEERFLTIHKPNEINRKNKIIGNTLFCHFAFWPQRNVLDNTNILSRYKKIVDDESNLS